MDICLSVCCTTPKPTRLLRPYWEWTTCGPHLGAKDGTVRICVARSVPAVRLGKAFQKQHISKITQKRDCCNSDVPEAAFPNHQSDAEMAQRWPREGPRMPMIGPKFVPETAYRKEAVVQTWFLELSQFLRCYQYDR